MAGTAGRTRAADAAGARRRAAGAGERRLQARVEGWDVHASRAFEADERTALECFCRYGLRGPIANGRLMRGPRGLVTYQLKQPKADGTTELLLSPMALLERLARLVPRRRQHLVRYGGVLAGGAALRAKVVPAPPDDLPLVMRHAGPRRLDWANLLRRVFALEVLACACGGTRRVTATLEEGPVARKILEHLGLPAEPPLRAPARLDQGVLFATGPPANDACEPPPEHEFDQRLPPSLETA